MNFLEHTKSLYDYIDSSLACHPEFNKYRLFYKVKSDDNCPADYIVFTCDANASLSDSCDTFLTSFTLRAVLVSSFRGSWINLEVLTYIYTKLLDYPHLQPSLVSYTDSIVSESCTNLITDLRVDFKLKPIESNIDEEEDEDCGC